MLILIKIWRNLINTSITKFNCINKRISKIKDTYKFINSSMTTIDFEKYLGFVITTFC